MLEHTLDDSAAIWMRGQALHLSGERIDDELYVLSRHPLDRFLYHVIAVLVFHASQNVLLELLHQGRLLISEDVLQCLRKSVIGGVDRHGRSNLLNNPATVHLQR